MYVSQQTEKGLDFNLEKYAERDSKKSNETKSKDVGN